MAYVYLVATCIGKRYSGRCFQHRDEAVCYRLSYGEKLEQGSKGFKSALEWIVTPSWPSAN